MPNIPELKIGNTTYKLKDGDLRRDIILAKSTQPTEECNKIWVNEAASEEYEVPTYEEFENLGSTGYNRLLFDSVGFNTTIGSTLTFSRKSTTRVSQTKATKVSKKTIVSVDTGYNVAVVIVDDDFIVLSDSGWKSGSYTISENVNYLVTLRKSDNSNISLSDISHVHFNNDVDEYITDLYKSVPNIVYLPDIVISDGFPELTVSGNTLSIKMPPDTQCLLPRLGGPESNIINLSNKTGSTTNSSGSLYYVVYSRENDTIRFVYFRHLNLINSDDIILGYASKTTKQFSGNVHQLYYPSEKEMNNIPFTKDVFVIGSIYANQGITPSVKYRICTWPIMLKYDYDISLSIDTGFQYRIVYYNADGSYSSQSDYYSVNKTIPAGTRFRIVIKRTTEDDAEIADLDTFFSKLHYTAIVADVTKTLIPVDYTFLSDAGDIIPFKKQRYNVSLINGFNSTIHSEKAEQGFAISNGVLFQLYSNDEVELINFRTGAAIDDFSISSGHGNNIDFSNEYYNVSDEFPLAYILTTYASTDAIVNVVRITRSTAEVIRQLTIPVANTGYYACSVLDKEHNILYMLGHTENSYYEDPNGTNTTIVSRWDLNNITSSGGVNTPAFIDSFTVPFIMTIQGCTIYDNKIVVCSSHWASTNTEIIFIDPYRKIICSKFTEFPDDIKHVETEGIAFVEDQDKYYMVIKPGGHTPYYRLDSNY